MQKPPRQTVVDGMLIPEVFAKTASRQVVFQSRWMTDVDCEDGMNDYDGMLIPEVFAKTTSPNGVFKGWNEWLQRYANTRGICKNRLAKRGSYDHWVTDADGVEWLVLVTVYEILLFFFFSCISYAITTSSATQPFVSS